jgi:hypothetical protein
MAEGIMRNRALLGFAAVIALFVSPLLVSPAQAIPLGTGDVLFAPGEPDPADGGTVIATLTTPFSVPGFFEGELIARVVADDANNPLGGLTFTYEVNNFATSPNPIARLTVTNYATFGIDGSYQLPLTGLPPTLMDRTSADVVGFSFLGVGSGQLFPGNTSALLVLQTNASLYTTTSASIIDSGAITVPTLGPAVPEPASLGALALAAGMLIRRRSH